MAFLTPAQNGLNATAANAAAATTPPPLNSNGTPISNTTWDASALGGNGAWVSNINGSSIIFPVDPKTGIASGAGGTDINGNPVADNSTPDGKGGWTAPGTGLNQAGFNPVKSAVGAVAPSASKVYNSTQVAGQPGVDAGPPVNPSQLVRDPTTGAYYDPTSGKSYTDAAGTQLITNPNVSQQVASNIQKANALFAQLPGAQQQQAGAFAGQTALAGQLQDVITNPNAQSVARDQLGEGVDASTAAANAMAAGHTGENAALAHIQAMRTAGDAQAKANQDAAMLRAQETASARNTLGTVLGAQAGEGQANVNTTLGAADDLTKTAGSEQGGVQGLNVDIGKANATTNKSWIDTAGHFLGSL